MSISNIGNNREDVLGAVAELSQNSTARTASISVLKTAENSSRRTQQNLTGLATENIPQPNAKLDLYA
jgi:hypothetical protein